MDLFEERGIVSPPSDSGAKRDILIDIFDIGAEELNYDSDYDEAFFDFKDNVKKEKRISEENSNNSVLAVVDSLLQHDDDEKMPYAIIYAIFTEKITVKDLYKHLEIGYARAAKLIDQMEVRGILDHPYSEDEVIFRKSKIFNYTDINNPPPDFAEDKQSKQEQKSSPKNEEKSKSPEADYYKILGVLPSATGVEIKKAWRKMVLEFHPDKVQGSGLSQDFIDFASEKLRKINEAYEEICKLRDDCR